MTLPEALSLEVLSGLEKPTPFFAFSLSTVKAKYNEFMTHFPDAIVNFAMKANVEPDILSTLYKEGANFEVASVYELRMLKALKIPGSKMIYGTSVKPVHHIREFHEYGVERYAADSFEEIEKIAQAAPGSRVYVRVTVNDTGSIFKFSEKFGTEKRNVIPLLLRAKELGLEPYGISFHVGSQASNPRAWAEAIEELVPILEELTEKHSIKVQMINLGGGFPCAYASFEASTSLEAIAGHTYEAYEKLPYKPYIMLEPGRAMVAESGVLVASVIGRVERREQTWLFLDAGVYNGLFETMAYQGSTRYHVSSLRPSYDAGEKLFALAGPTGDSPDVISREASLPQDMNVGDKLVFHDVGAYSLVAVSPFNGFPKPDIYFL
jgi:ornithine decarboxylase